MANFGVVLNIVGKINIIDVFGDVRELLVGDEILASDTLVGVESGISKIVFSNGYEVALSIAEGWKDSKYLIIRAEEEITSDFFKHFDSSNAEQLLNSLILNEDFFNSLPESAAGRSADLESNLESGDSREDSANNNRSTLRADTVAHALQTADKLPSAANPVVKIYQSKKSFVDKENSTFDSQDSSTDSNNTATSGSADAAENSGSSSTAHTTPTETPISFRQKFLTLMNSNPNQSEIAALGVIGVP